MASFPLVAPGVLPIVEYPITIRVATVPYANLADLTTDQATEWLYQQTRVNIEWYMLPANSESDTIDLMLSSGARAPDVFLGPGTMDREQTAFYGDKGFFLPMNDYIARYSVEINRLFREYPIARSIETSPDGGIYALSQYDPCRHCHTTGIWYNATWLDRLGRGIPETTEEFFETLKAFRDDDPNGNGLVDEIPFTGAATTLAIVLEGYLMDSFEYNHAGEQFNIGDGRISAAFTSDTWRQGLRLLNGLYAQGVIDPDGFSQGEDKMMYRIGPDVDRYGALVATVPVGMTRVEGELLHDYRHLIAFPETKAQSRGFSGVPDDRSHKPMVAITYAAKYPAAVFRWIDYMYGESIRWGYGSSFGSKDAYRLPPLRDERDELWRAVSDYAHASIVSFVKGEKNVDTDWDAYLVELKEFGLNDYLKLSQAAVDRDVYEVVCGDDDCRGTVAECTQSGLVSSALFEDLMSLRNNAEGDEGCDDCRGPSAECTQHLVRDSVGAR